MQNPILSVKNNSRASGSTSYLSEHLVSVSSQCYPHI